MMHKNQSVDVHQFAMVPRADIPRSTFNIEKAHKSTFNAGDLVPIFLEEVLPGDTFAVDMTIFARMATPIFPIMDNLHMETFFFFVPNRLVWTNWKRFQGEQKNPADSISYTVPTITSPVAGFSQNGLYDHFGIPTAGQTAGSETVTINALPLRAYNLIYNEWFRDENLTNSVAENLGDGPDTYTDYALKRRLKRHDYFTSALPWPQKGNAAVTLPLGAIAPVIPTGDRIPLFNTSGDNVNSRTFQMTASTNNTTLTGATFGVNQAVRWDATANATKLVADLSQATAATINQLRTAFQIQKLLERDARGGTRYTEIIRSHFGVISPDARLQRPEYLGGSHSPIIINPVAQTSASNLTGGSTPLAALSAIGTSLHRKHAFSQSFTEHGHVIGIACIRADLTYQQGLRKLWDRRTRYDFYMPVFAALGEQAVLRQEIYCTGNAVNDKTVWGYQERWAEYRYSPSSISGKFRSTHTGTLDGWHLAQNFVSAPTLGASFIEEAPPMSRILAAGGTTANAEFIFDSFWKIRATRPMPLYSVPGLIDHF